jgi:hypothetical protein
MLRETLYTSIGAAALTVDFVAHPERSQSWLKKAERRGNRIASQYGRSLRSLTKDAGSTLDDLRKDLRKNPLAVFGIERNGVETRRPSRPARRSVRRRTSTARARRPRRNGATRVTVQRTAVAS